MDLSKLTMINQQTRDIVSGFIKETELLFPPNNPYYNIIDSIQNICLLYFNQSIYSHILTDLEEKYILSIFTHANHSWQLLYRLPQDDQFNFATFHKKCHGKHVIIFIQTKQEPHKCNVFAVYDHLPHTHSSSDSSLWWLRSDENINYSKDIFSIHQHSGAKKLSNMMKEANNILIKIISLEKSAYKSRNNANMIHSEITNKMQRIQEQSKIVDLELSQVKMAAESAKKAVSHITQQELNELTQINNPPQMVQYTINAVMILMGKKVNQWQDIQKIVASHDFVVSILNLDITNVKEKIRKKIWKKYLSNNEWDYEMINKVSKVAAILWLWVTSQIKFGHMLDSVEPMVREISELKKDLIVKRNMQRELRVIIEKRENEIAQHKEDYQKMIEEITMFKNEIAIVSEAKGNIEIIVEKLSDENENMRALYMKSVNTFEVFEL